MMSTEIYTVETLAIALNTEASKLATRIKTMEKLKATPDLTSEVKTETATKLLAMFQAIAHKQLPTQLPPPQQQEVGEKPQYEPEVGRLTIKEIKGIAKQYKVTRKIALELELELTLRYWLEDRS